MNKPTPLIEQIRAALKAGAKSRYQLSRETGIDQPQLSRFWHAQHGLGLPALERLAFALGLEIRAVPIKPARKKKGR